MPRLQKKGAGRVMHIKAQLHFEYENYRTKLPLFGISSKRLLQEVSVQYGMSAL